MKRQTSKLISVGMVLIAGINLVIGNAIAAPRMDTAEGTSEVRFATVLPDHEVKDLYYVFPEGSEIALKANGKYAFVYMETYASRSWGRRRLIAANAAMWIKPSIESEQLKLKMADIKAANPNAKFAVVTAFKTEVVQTKAVDTPFFLSNDCGQIAGPLEAPVYCPLSINPAMSTALRTLIKTAQAQVIHYVYHFYGWDGAALKTYTFSVPLRYGSLEGKGYFIDQNGNELN